MLKGIDVSSYQSTSYSTTGMSFVGIKVTEGLTYVNPKWTGQRATARAAGLVTIFYHYPHIANSAAAEADHFLAQINLQPGDVLCLDWEWYGQNVTDAQARAYKDAWIARVRSKAPGHKVIVYADRNSWLNVDTDSNCGDGLWIADYVTAGQPRITAAWRFHQYSDSPLDQDVANFATAAELKTWAGVSGGSSKGAEIYPGANATHWYSSAYPGDPMTTNTVAWHSTETTALPDYSGGSIAPNLTAVPDFANQRLVWYQHFNFDESSRALVHATGQMATNTLNVAQVEIVGTCDPSTHASWTKAGIQHLYMPELPDWAIRDLNHFAHWAHDAHGVPLTSGLKWLPYPQSYGSNGVRMTTAAWSAFTGHCGHQHVPENDHGDPGAFPIAQILEADMPLSTTDVTTLTKTDNVLSSPDGAKDPTGNAYWTMESYFRYGFLQDRETNALVKGVDQKLDAVQATGLTDEQVQAIADKVAANPALASAIADKVADLIATRLAN
ncbi:glycoside hydrolase family 25 protein [Streptomyces sp. NPDC020801]|uniref:glycoside hydrolase family 25 protein n=1 Tax=Streptomyces sp. NPDC020801 TaxID=3365093 RepID=UPI0037A48EE9